MAENQNSRFKIKTLCVELEKLLGDLESIEKEPVCENKDPDSEAYKSELMTKLKDQLQEMSK